MTPELLQRLRVATDTVVARWGRPIKAPAVVALNPNDSFSVTESPPLIFEQGQVKIILQQVTAGIGLHGLTNPADVEVHALAADALAWALAVEAGTTAPLWHNSGVLLYEKVAAGHQLSIGVGPGYVGDGSGNLFYGGCVYGPIIVTESALAALLAGIRSIVA